MSRLKALLSTLPALRILSAQLSHDSDKKFPQFSSKRFPQEIRDLIWRHAAFEPNVIPLVDCYSEPPRTQHCLPGVLLACRTSRVEAQKHYTKVTEQRLRTNRTREASRTVYINFAVDRFNCASTKELGFWGLNYYNFLAADLRKIRFFEVEFRCGRFPQPSDIFLYRRFFEIDGLKRCTLKLLHPLYIPEDREDCLLVELDRKEDLEDLDRKLRRYHRRGGGQLNFELVLMWRQQEEMDLWPLHSVSMAVQPAPPT